MGNARWEEPQDGRREGRGELRHGAARRDAAPADSGLEYGFAAAFIPVRHVRLDVRPGARLPAAGEVASTAAGQFWWVDPHAADVRIYGSDGRLLHVLRGGSRLADLCAPVSVAPFHGSWIAVLDAGAGRVSFYDGRARRQGGFDLPHVDEPLQLRNLADRHLAVLGSGGGRVTDRWVHLYRPDGRHLESVFSLAHRTGGRPARNGSAPASGATALQSAAAGRSLWLAYQPAAGVVLYDFESRLVRSFPLEVASDAGSLCGLFAAPHDGVVVMFREPEPGARYVYELYAATGERVLGPIRSPQRLVGVEGKLFFSIDPGADEEGPHLRICRLRDLG